MRVLILAFWPLLVAVLHILQQWLRLYTRGADWSAIAKKAFLIFLFWLTVNGFYLLGIWYLRQREEDNIQALAYPEISKRQTYYDQKIDALKKASVLHSLAYELVPIPQSLYERGRAHRCLSSNQDLMANVIVSFEVLEEQGFYEFKLSGGEDLYLVDNPLTLLKKGQHQIHLGVRACDKPKRKEIASSPATLELTVLRHASIDEMFGEDFPKFIGRFPSRSLDYLESYCTLVVHSRNISISEVSN